MKHLQKAPRKPLFDKKQGEIFIAYIDDYTELFEIFTKEQAEEKLKELVK